MRSEFGTLLKAARNLDPEALTAIFDMFSPALYKFVSRFVHDPSRADLIVADVFAQLVEEFATGNGPRGNLRCHLYQAAYQLMVLQLGEARSSSSLQVAISSRQADRPELTPSPGEEQIQGQVLLSTMNTELSEDQRLVIILRFLEDFSLKETADILGKSISNIKVIQSRGLVRLRKALGLQHDQNPGKLLRY